MARERLLFSTLGIWVFLFLPGCIHHQAEVKDLPSTGVEVKDAQRPTRGPTDIEILYPSDRATTEKAEIGLVATIHVGEPLKEVSVLVNAQSVTSLDLSRESQVRGGDQLPLEVAAPLGLGSNRITIEITTRQGRSLQKTIVVNRVEVAQVHSSTVIRKRWAVVIGISEYQHARRGIPPLQFAHRDALALMEFLHSPRGGGFEPAYTRLLINEQATTRNIRSALFTFLKQAGKDDLVLIFFAGHGAPEIGRPENLYLISYDSDPDDLASTAFPMWDMETALERYIVAERVVVLADACHSAGVGPTAGLRSVGGNNLINTYLANLQKTKPGRVTITASEVNEFSQESEIWEDHGVFTHFLLKGLKGAADSDENGVVTISEAFTYVNSKVRRATNSQQHPNIQGRFDPNLPLSVTP